MPAQLHLHTQLPDQVNGLIRSNHGNYQSTAQRGLSAGNVLIRPVSNRFTILSMPVPYILSIYGIPYYSAQEILHPLEARALSV